MKMGTRIRGLACASGPALLVGHAPRDPMAVTRHGIQWDVSPMLV